MPRYIFLLSSLAFAFGCTVESQPVATKAPSNQSGSNASPVASDDVAVTQREPGVQADFHGQSWTISGEVFDKNGELSDGFQAAAVWSSNGVYWNEAGVVPPEEVANVWKREGVLAARPANLAEEISKGTFSLTIHDRPRAPVFVVNMDHAHGGIALVGRSATGHPVRIDLTPLVRITAEIFCPEAGRSPDWTLAQIYVVGGDNIPLTSCGTFEGRVYFSLPVGDYEISAKGEGPVSRMKVPEKPERLPLHAVYRRGQPFRVPAGIDELDLGVLDLHLPTEAEGNPVNSKKLYDQPAPELSITDARGVPKNVKISDFHGKWVLLDFWAIWCGPCVEDGLPKLTKFYSENSDLRDHFEILAVCNTSHEEILNIADYEERTSELRKIHWENKSLPFPVLLDGEGKTYKDYAVSAWPTTFLLDPKGRIVEGGDLKMLADLLRKLREVPD